MFRVGQTVYRKSEGAWPPFVRPGSKVPTTRPTSFFTVVAVADENITCRTQQPPNEEVVIPVIELATV